MKSKSKILYYFVSTIMIVIIMFSVFRLKNKLDLKYSQLEEDKNLSNYVMSTQLLNANSSIAFEIDKNVIVEDLNNNKMMLTSLISSENVLIYRISSSHCSSCDKAGLESLLTHKSQIKDKDIIIISSFYNSSLMNSFKEEHNIKHKMYNLKQSINLKIEELNQPYFLVLTKDLEVLSCFFPEKAMVNLTDDYFYGIQHLFNTKE